MEMVGPVFVEGLGEFIVPGKTNEERERYAEQLYKRKGIFIPPDKCMS